VTIKIFVSSMQKWINYKKTETQITHFCAKAYAQFWKPYALKR